MFKNWNFSKSLLFYIKKYIFFILGTEEAEKSEMDFHRSGWELRIVKLNMWSRARFEIIFPYVLDFEQESRSIFPMFLISSKNRDTFSPCSLFWARIENQDSRCTLVTLRDSRIKQLKLLSFHKTKVQVLAWQAE